MSAPPAPDSDPVAAIDAALGCLQCGRQLARSAPSADFCSEHCQTAWHAARATSPPADAGHRPVRDLPETGQPLHWLEPAPTGPVDRPGHEVLDAVAGFVARFSVFPDEHCAPTLALWYAHTHAADRFYVTPRLIIDSAEPESGKTRVLEVAQYLVRAPEMTISATTAALFRLVTAGPITILFDEVDTIFNQHNDSNEDLRGLLNAGYKNGATIARCVGDAKAMKVQRFPVYAPAALAGIAGKMPATITTRAITIHMRRRRPDQTVEQFRHRAIERQAQPIRTALATWIDTVGEQISTAEPIMPDGVTDRSAEIWEPLLAIADAAGDHWPNTARAACTHFVHNNGPQYTSTGVRLLADLRTIFTRHNTDRITTADLIHELRAMDEAPWGDLHGKPLDARRLSKELTRYGVKPKNLKAPTGTVAKGYRTDGEDGLADAWSRYLPPTAATAATTQVSAVADRNPDPLPPLPDHADDPPAEPDPTTSSSGSSGYTRPSVTTLTSQVAAVAAVADPTRGTR